MSSKGTIRAVIFWALSKEKKLTTNVYYDHETKNNHKEDKENLQKTFSNIIWINKNKDKHTMCTKANGNTKYEQKCVQK